ncbi:hypothetical protein OKW21_000465 [Catalinimonas alkaloidigena]|nr:hypothetical protein [Catalinimonas alkaloidigena]
MKISLSLEAKISPLRYEMTKRMRANFLLLKSVKLLFSLHFIVEK